MPVPLPTASGSGVMSAIEARTERFALDGNALRALSNPNSLHFLLGVELELFACSLKRSPGKPLRVTFPPLAAPFEKLLRQTAARLGLSVQPLEEKAGLVVSGEPSLPLLRYVDYMPGGLHLDEILIRFNVTPLETPSLDPVQTGGASCFTAHAIPYERFSPERYKPEEPYESVVISGLGHYLLLEMGLQMATHSHLVYFALRPNVKDLDKAIRKFQGFSGWTKFDLRWENESEKTSGVLVFPTVADAVELLEAFEDEDESSDENRLPFSLEPVAPCVSVPYMEDVQLKKLRPLHFLHAVRFWETPGASARDRFTVMATSFSERVSIAELMKLFDVESVVDAALYVDESPHRRRRLMIRFKDLESTRVALESDGRHYHGAPLRVSVAPPYVSSSRCGIELATFKGEAKAPPPLRGPSHSPTSSSSKGMNLEAKPFIPRFLQGNSPQMGSAPTTSPPAAIPSAPPPPYEEVKVRPPAYDSVVSALPSYDESLKPPPPYTASPGVSFVPSTSPPSYSMMAPPPYTATPNNSFNSPEIAAAYGVVSPTGPPPMYLPPAG